MIKSPKILFFIPDCVPSDEEVLEAQAYGGRVYFRNATAVPEPVFEKVLKPGGKSEKKLLNGNFMEACDGVAGDVPALYEGVPSADKALEEFEAGRKKALVLAKAAAKKKQEAKDAAAKVKAEEAEHAKVVAANEKAKKAAEAKKKKEANAATENWTANK